MARPVWSRPADAVVLVLRGRTARVAVPVAAVVGTVISVVNQAGVIVAGEATGLTWVRIAVNFVVPYIVASVAYLSACRSTHGR
ncbi:nitrate/nitrite transporter NrtS [Actinophytocola sp. KF-1]